MRRETWRFYLFTGMLLLASLACSLPSIGGTSAPEPTPTPPGDTITFTVPAYTAGLQPGDTVPGTRLQYVGRNGDAFDVVIDGFTAVKRTGDSFIWDGILAPGVFANYNLRLATVIFGEMRVAGPVKLTILNPTPVERTDTNPLTAQISFSNALINYYVPVGYAIPGTTAVYQGLRPPGPGVQQGQQGAFTGLSNYPYLAAGDSLIWQGYLRDNFIVAYNLRAISVGEEGVRFAGTAELFILP
jgi:hypothetical protein